MFSFEREASRSCTVCKSRAFRDIKTHVCFCKQLHLLDQHAPAILALAPIPIQSGSVLQGQRIASGVVVSCSRVFGDGFRLVGAGGWHRRFSAVEPEMWMLKQSCQGISGLQYVDGEFVRTSIRLN